MSRLKKYASVPSLLGEEVSNSLRKQNRYGMDAWQPGEIPTRTGSLRPVTGPLDDMPQPHGEFMAIQKPKNRGIGYSPIDIVDVEGHETNRKQK